MLLGNVRQPAEARTLLYEPTSSPAVAHRALVAYQRADGQYNCHRSRWGADRLRLLSTVTPATPYGRPRSNPPVERSPRRTVESLTTLAATVDYRRYEAVYVVAADAGVGAYLPLWLGLSTVARSVTDGDPTDGLLMAVTDQSEAAALRRWFRAEKAAVGRLIDREAIDAATGRNRLERRVRSHAGERRLLG